MSLFRILEVLDRAHHGPYCSVQDWDFNVVPAKLNAKLEKYHLRDVWDRDIPVNLDDDLADTFFKAGWELAAEIGYLCQDTERIIEVSEEELADVVSQAPNRLDLGEGADKIVLRPRRPESPIPVIVATSLGIVVSQDVWIPFVQGMAQYPEIDIVEPPSLASIFGRPVLGGTPYETLAGRIEAQMAMEALWRAGRPGAPSRGVISSTTCFGQLGGYGMPGGYRPRMDLACILAPAELKTTYDCLHKVVHTLNCNGVIYSGVISMPGGYAGPPEAAAVANIASFLLQFYVHLCQYGLAQIMDVRNSGNTGREAEWVMSVVYQALSRNTDLLICGVTDQLAGPCTEMLLQETAVSMLNMVASGVTGVVGPRSAGGKYSDHISPLECKFMGEIAKRANGLSREKACEIAQVLIPKYEDNLMAPPKGKKFADCFALETLKPTEEWQNIYLQVKGELIGLGVPLDLPYSSFVGASDE